MSRRGGADHRVHVVVSRPPPNFTATAHSGGQLRPARASDADIASRGQVRQFDFRASAPGFDLTAGEITVGLTVPTEGIGFSVGYEIGVKIGGRVCLTLHSK